MKKFFKRFALTLLVVIVLIIGFILYSFPVVMTAMGRAAKSYQRNGPRFKNGLKKIG